MKPELQAKFLQHLNKKKTDSGFTLIELLVVIIIIGILAAIALPSLLAQSNKARQSEARNNTGTLNRAQQAYYLEKQAFTESFADLGVGISEKTANYEYFAKSSGSGSTSVVANISKPINTGVLKAYAGVVYVTLIKQAGSAEQTATQAKACEGKTPLIDPISAAPTGFTDCSTSIPSYIDLGG